VVSVNGTTAPIIPPGRTTGPGVVDEQPIALVQVTAGVASPTAYIDLRVWAGNGGVIADNWLALTYLDSLGTSLYTNNDGKRYTRTIGQDGNPLWIASVPDAYTPLWGVGQTLSGGIPAVSEGHPPAFLIQAGTYVTHFDDAGYARIIFPRPFPNGLLYVSGFNGDDYATGGSMTFASAGHVWGAEGYGTPASWVYTGRAQDASDDGAGSLMYNRNWCRGRIHRINWLAIGW
jgi:hypothetical protein